MLADLLQLSRSLRRAPAVTTTVVLTLSLTLGVGASIFAVVDGLLEPPPFADPDALVALGETPIDEPSALRRTVAYTTFAAWQQRAGSLAAIEAYDGTNLTLTELGPAERVSATDVTAGFLTLLGVAPALGRTFTADDLGQRVVILGYDFWRRRLAADPGVLGRALVLGGERHTIVGVLPERFVFELNRSDVWRPLPFPAGRPRPGYRVGVVGRLSGGVPAPALEAALDDISRAGSPPMRASATPVAIAIAGDATRASSLIAGAAAIALLVAFTNLAGLMVVRSIDRRRELAVRSALGARAFQISRLVLLEAQVLVLLGTAGGILVAAWTTPAIGRLALEQFGDLAGRDVTIGWQAIAMTAAAALVCTWVCALLPALAAGRRSTVDELRRGATLPRGERALRRTLVAGEVALAFVLLVSLAIVGGSLVTVLRAHPGFESRDVLALQLSLPEARYPAPGQVASFYSTLHETLIERLAPATVSIVDELPLTGSSGRTIANRDRTDAGPEAVVRTAGIGYFDVMRIPVLSGRPFGSEDRAGAPPRVVISAGLAARLFGSARPIGQQIWLAGRAQAAEVIGVVGDVAHAALNEPLLPTIYVAGLQDPSRSSIIVVHSPRFEAEVVDRVREAVSQLDASVPVYGIRPMADVVARSPGVPIRRLLAAAFGGFAMLAVLLAATGLFGVVAHDVASRRAELAVRTALGAHPVRIARSVAAQGVWMVAAGLLAGIVLSVWAVRALGAAGFASGSLDTTSISLAVAILFAAAAAAVLPAARRAVRTDALIALRSE